MFVLKQYGFEGLNRLTNNEWNRLCLNRTDRIGSVQALFVHDDPTSWHLWTRLLGPGMSGGPYGPCVMVPAGIIVLL